MSYYVYILLCKDNTYYTGITKDVTARIREHNGEDTYKKGAKYTRGRRPVKLVYKKECKDRSEALKEEIRIKKLTRKEKENLL